LSREHVLVFDSDDDVADVDLSTLARSAEMDPAQRARLQRRTDRRRSRARRRGAAMRHRGEVRHGSRILFAVLLLLAVTLILVDQRTEGSALSSGRSAVGAVVGPLQSGAVWALSPFLQRDAAERSPEADALREENERLRAQLLARSSDMERLSEAEALLDLAGRAGYTIVAAEVAGRSPGTSQAIAVDVGSRDGIEIDQAVMSGGGLIGRVVEVAPDSATVRLISDVEARVGARVVGRRDVGFLSGTGETDAVALTVLDGRALPEVGDTVVTYGSPGNRPFPPGLPVGIVEDVVGSGGDAFITVAPFSNPADPTIVGVVVQSPREDPRDSLSPSTRAGGAQG